MSLERAYIEGMVGAELFRTELDRSRGNSERARRIRCAQHEEGLAALSRYCDAWIAMEGRKALLDAMCEAQGIE